MLTPIPFYVVDAFTREPFAGNPAGVFIDTDARLSDAQMRQMAGEVHLESAFVLPPTPEAHERGADFRLRYWTGVMEVPLCGHATVAAITVLCQSGRIPFGPQDARGEVRVQTNVGILHVQVLRLENGWAVRLHQNIPVFGAPLAPGLAARVLSALGASSDAAVSGLPLQVVSTGTPWLLAPVKNRASVNNAPADLNAITAISGETDSFGVYVFALEIEGERVQTWGRCFAPIVGLSEDPVTGSASGALGGYLAHHGVLPVPSNGAMGCTAQQGWAGGRGGKVEIGVSRDADGVLGVSVSGEAVVVAEGSFQV